MRDPLSELAELDGQSLRRGLRVPKPGIRHFSGNDYLGLARHPEVVEAFQQGLMRYGAGSGSSRLVCGTSYAHEELEAWLAREKGAEAALTFSSGYATAVGTLTALAKKGDILILDKLCHASLIDGAKLSGATLRVYPHGDVERLMSLATWAQGEVQEENRIMIVTESRFSMDGDEAVLADVVEVKETVGAWLLLDEAHSFGIDGPRGAGLAAKWGLSERVDLHLGTLSKAVGLVGGFVAASKGVIDLLVNRARSFIYSTAPPAALAVAALKSAQIIASEEGDGLRTRLCERIDLFRNGIPKPEALCNGPIQPILMGEESRALAASKELEKRGFFVPAIRYPTVARRAARLRVTLSAVQSLVDVQELAEAVGAC